MKTDVKKVKVGNKLSMTTFMEVESIGLSSVNVIDEDGKGLTIGYGVFESNIWSTQVKGVAKTPKTGIAEILMNAKDAIIQVCFDKADGTERTLTGYVIGAEVVLGRTIAIDTEKPKKIRKGKDGKEFDERQRLVDHRTLKWLIYKNVKYFVK